MFDFEDFKISKKVREKLKHRSELKREMAQGKTVQEILGFSNEIMDKFASAAHVLLEHQRYVDAGNAFLFLAILNPHNDDYWLSLGTAAQLCHDYEGAFDAYEMAAYARVENPVPYFYLAKCLFAMHERESTLEALDIAIEYSDEIPEFEDLKRQALAAKEILLKSEGRPSEE